jgi:hypothetical protein
MKALNATMAMLGYSVVISLSLHIAYIWRPWR